MELEYGDLSACPRNAKAKAKNLKPQALEIIIRKSRADDYEISLGV
jgi:hypothetical protein